MRVDNQQHERHLRVAVFEDVFERVFQPVTAVTPDLGEEIIALRQPEGRGDHRARRIQRVELERLHALVDLRAVKGRAAQQIAEELPLQHLRVIVHLLALPARIPRGERAAGGADLPAQMLLVPRGFHAEHFRATREIRKEFLALAHAEQGGNRIIAAMAEQINALLRVFRDVGLLKAEGIPLGITAIQRTDFLFIGNQQQFVHDASKGKAKNRSQFRNNVHIIID